jgi:hypothetical protein
VVAVVVLAVVGKKNGKCTLYRYRNGSASQGL